MNYLVSESTKRWIDETRLSEGDRQRRQYLPRFTSPRGGGGATDVKILRITGGNAVAGYTVQVYAGYAQLALDESEGEAHFYPTEIGMDGDLPNGTIVVGHKVQLAITGGE